MSDMLPPPPVPLGLPADDKLWALACHLSLLIGVGFILPLIVWLAKKESSPLTAAHACEALNFHLCLYLYGLCCIPLVFLFCIGYALMPVIGVFGVICAVMAAVEAWKGNFYRYPLTFRLFS